MNPVVRVYEDLRMTVKKRKLKWYGHVSGSSCIAKTVLQGLAAGKWGRRRHRQKRSLKDNITA